MAAIQFPETRTSREIAEWLAKRTGSISKRCDLWARWVVTRWGRKEAWWIAEKIEKRSRYKGVRDPGKVLNHLLQYHLTAWMKDEQYYALKRRATKRDERYFRKIKPFLANDGICGPVSLDVNAYAKELFRERQAAGLTQSLQTRSDEDPYPGPVPESPRGALRSPVRSLPCRKCP